MSNYSDGGDGSTVYIATEVLTDFVVVALAMVAVGSSITMMVVIVLAARGESQQL